MELPSKKEVRPVLFPLNVSDPCMFWPRGQRVGDPKPCLMLHRENNDVVSLIELRHGQCVQHEHVRHVDDPYFVDHPNARHSAMSGGGAWDYSPGLVYRYFVPGKPKNMACFQELALPMEWVQLALHLANEGWEPGKIATELSQKGFTKDRISEILEVQRK